ncbi:MAG: flagellar motor protein MotD [Thiobacillus sp. 65-29]|jgi:chemotaxis protein MotB|nr:MAG: flagellar motor protein MotD [Thiobacillus sp. 65-29]
MRRRRRLRSDHENHDRWLISYADFITLLFAFFVVMYAVSAVNEQKYRVVAESLGGAFGKVTVGGQAPLAPPAGPATHAVAPPERNPLVQEEAAYMNEVASGLLDVLGPLVKEGKVRITQGRRGVSIEINANVLFQPGKAELEPGSLEVLRAVAGRLRDEPFNLEITGHTDLLPISNSSFASNWELSAVRATSVVRHLAANGIASERMQAIGREATRPVAPNNTPEGRARNRRVELMILSGLPDTLEELPVRRAP